MNKIELTTAEVREIGGKLFQKWDEYKPDIRLKGRALLDLIGLKKALENHTANIEEALMTLVQQFDGEPQQDGSIHIPEEQRAAANKAFIDFSKEKVEIAYREIQMTDEDSLPIDLLDLLYFFMAYQD